MAVTADPDRARQQIENALAVVRATRPEDARAVRSAFGLVVPALEAARAALDELDSELDVATGPNRDSVEELVHAQQKLEKAELAMAELEQRLALERAEREAVETVEQEDRARIAKLEKANADFEARLLEDDDAFDRYFEKALDEQDRKRKKPPRGRA